MKLYFHPLSRAATTLWMFAELEAPYESVVLDFTAGESSTPEYRAINPMGKVPALVDGDVVVTETAAICAYLADQFADRGLAPAIESKARGAYYRYLFFPGTTLEPALTLAQLEVELENPGSVGWGDVTRVLATIEAMTPLTEWAIGEKFTTADVVFGGTLDSGIRFGWLEPSAKVMAYVERLRERPAYKESHPGW